MTGEASRRKNPPPSRTMNFATTVFAPSVTPSAPMGRPT